MGPTMTAADFIGNLNQEQHAAFVAGALPVLAFSDRQAGPKAYAWYYGGNGPHELAAVAHKNPHLPVSGIMSAFIRRQV